MKATVVNQVCDSVEIIGKTIPAVGEGEANDDKLQLAQEVGVEAIVNSRKSKLLPAAVLARQ